MERILVTDGGGFIGSHLAKYLYLQGNFVKVLGWEPEVSLKEGLAKTYRWIEAQCVKDKLVPDALHIPATKVSSAQLREQLWSTI